MDGYPSKIDRKNQSIKWRVHRTNQKKREALFGEHLKEIKLKKTKGATASTSNVAAHIVLAQNPPGVDQGPNRSNGKVRDVRNFTPRLQ